MTHTPPPVPPADFDPNTVLTLVTDDDRDQLVAALTAMIDAKIAFWRDQKHYSDELMETATEALQSISFPGAVLYGDLGDAIASSRGGLVMSKLAGR